MLAGQHHGVDAVRLAVHIAHGHLALGVRAQERQAAVFAQLRLTLNQAVCVVNGRRHELGGLAASVAEHQALVTGACVQVVVRRMVHALSDVVALLVISHQHRAALVVNAVLGVVVADAFDGVARHLDVVHMRVGGDLAGQHHQTGVAQGLSGHAGLRVLLENCVEDRVRNLVGDLVRVAFGYGLGCEKKIVRHAVALHQVSRRVAGLGMPRRTL